MKVSAEKKRVFIDTLVRGQSPSGAAHAIGIDRVTAYRWRGADPAFAEAWIEARETQVEMIETVLYRQAAGGDLGAICFFLKAHKPEIYNRRMGIALGGDADNPLNVMHHVDAEPWVVMMPENHRDKPERDLDAGPTIEGDADDDQAA